MGRRKPKSVTRVSESRFLKKAPEHIPIELGTMQPHFRPETQKGNYIIQIFWNVDMRCNHVGLSKVAKEHGDVDVTDLTPGEMCIFVNTAKTKMKILGGCSEKDSMGIMSYYQSPRGRIDLQALEYIPESFSAKRGIAYDEALKTSLTERLKKRVPPKKRGDAAAGLKAAAAQKGTPNPPSQPTAA